MARVVMLEFEEDVVRVKYSGESSVEVDEARQVFHDWLESLHGDYSMIDQALVAGKVGEPGGIG